MLRFPLKVVNSAPTIKGAHDSTISGWPVPQPDMNRQMHAPRTLTWPIDTVALAVAVISFAVSLDGQVNATGTFSGLVTDPAGGSVASFRTEQEFAQ